MSTWGCRERERLWQAAELVGHAAFLKSADLPTLIAGDFNDWRNTLGRHCLLAHGFRQATAPLRRFRTFPAFLPLAAIDKIYYRGPLRIDAAQRGAQAGWCGGRRTIGRWCAISTSNRAGRDVRQPLPFFPSPLRASGTHRPL